jgi:hypothetical protein
MLVVQLPSAVPLAKKKRRLPPRARRTEIGFYQVLNRVVTLYWPLNFFEYFLPYLFVEGQVSQQLFDGLISLF